MIDDALAAMKSKEENETNDAIVQDLRDKKKKWANVDKETEPKKTVTEPPPEQEPPPEKEPPPEGEQKESKIFKLFA